MFSIFAVALLLSLTAADSNPDECVNLNKTLSAEELPTIIGKWITHEVYILSSHDHFKRALESFSSSHVEFISYENNQTISFTQVDMRNESCNHFSVNFTVVGNSFQVNANHNSTIEAYFLKTCDDCLMMLYTITSQNRKSGTFLFFLTKTKLLPDKEKAMEQAKCLGFLEPLPFIYEQAELCPDESNTTKAKETEE